MITINRELGSGGRTVGRKLAERRILEALARQKSCVVAGRSTFLMFKEWPNHLNVFIQAPLLNRIDRLARKRGITTEEALHILEEVDESRESYVQKYTDKSRYDTRNYDLVINMADMTEDEAVDVIMAYIR